MSRRRPPLPVLLLLVLMLVLLLPAPPAAAGPVDWREVPATGEGRQWWDAGSLRVTRDGRLSVLSRFLPAGDDARGSLYVMELDCEQELYRDTSVNGLPQFRAEWQAAAGDALSTATVRAACRAGSALLEVERRG
ncbi:MAG: hypothetical protein VKI81_02230 [Synechococcaceae cyanobacterium]|nr:hypothetical protein [Synechococcaceae cyanobacterium]